jgi:hypothetical protein
VGLGGRHAARDVLFFFFFEMEAQLVVNGGAELSLAKPGLQSSKE